MIDWLYRVTLNIGVALLAISLLAMIFARLSPSIRCWLWRAGYLKCLMTMVVAISISLPLLPAAPPELPFIPSAAPETTSIVASNPPSQAMPQDLPVEVVAPAVASTPAFTLTDFLVALYLTGVAVALLRWGYSVARAFMLWHSAVPIFMPEADELSGRLGLHNTPRIARHPHISMPLYTFGGVLLPKAVSTNEHLALAHELAHVRRRDLAWEVLGGLVQLTLWFHPLVWWARRQEALAREQAADALALSVSGASPADYARVLFTNATQRGAVVLAVGAFDRPSLLRQRIAALGKPTLTPTRARLCVGLLVLVTLPALLPWRAVARQTPKPASIPVYKPVPNVVHFGKVIRLDRSPIAGAQITLQRRGKAVEGSFGRNQFQWEDLASMRTAADGTFSFSGVFPASARIVVSATGFATTERYDFDKVHGWRATLRPPIRWEAIVIDEKGRPFAGKRIQTNSGKLGTTDAAGRYVVTDGEETSRPWGLFRTNEPGWVLKSLDIRRKNGLIVERLIAQRGVTIGGELVNQRGEPVSFASIHIIAYGKVSHNPISVKLDRKGHFRSELLPPGDYRVTISPSRHRLAEKLAPRDFLRVTLATQGTYLRVVLTPGTTVQGVVTDSKTGKPLPEVYVWATRPVYIIRQGERESSDQSLHGLATLTDAQGRYSLQVPPSEEIILTVKSQKHPRISQRDLGPAMAKISGTKEGQVRIQNFALRLEEPIAGQVVNEQGEPVAGVTLSIPGSYMERKVGVTNQNGQFSIAEGYFFFANKYILLAKKGDERGQWQASNLKSYKPIRLVLKSKQTITVQGSVPAGIRGAFVKLSAEQSGIKRMSRVSVKADGRFAVNIDPEMPLYVEIGAPGFGTVRRKLPAAAPGSTVNLGHLPLPRADGSVSGNLTDENGRPITNAGLSISGIHAGAAARLTESGGFAASGLVSSDKLIAAVVITEGRKWKVWSIPLPAKRRHGLSLRVTGPPTAVFGG